MKLLLKSFLVANCSLTLALGMLVVAEYHRPVAAQGQYYGGAAACNNVSCVEPCNSGRACVARPGQECPSCQCIGIGMPSGQGG